MAQDGPVIYSRPLFVLRRVHVLYIHEDEIHVLHHLGKHRIRAIAAGFHRLMQLGKKLYRLVDEGPLEGGLAAGEGHAAAFEHGAFFQFFRQLFRLHLLAGHAPQALGTGGNALSAGHAVLRMGADGPAFSAMGTGRHADHQLRFRGKALGIVAPAASQGAALQKHRGAHSRAVVYGEFLNVKNRALHFRASPPRDTR